MNHLYIENKIKAKIPDESIFISLSNLLIESMELKYFVEINLIIVSKDEIRKLNNEYRNIDKYTDVLSFPINAEENLKEKWNFELLGDIYISDYVIKKNAIKNSHSIIYEYSYMFLHSVLHLLGYDHIEKTENIWMDEYIKKIIKKQGIII